MDTTATVRFVANGYILNTTSPDPLPPDVLAEMYVATLPEVVFWIDKIFNPPAP